MNTKKIIKEQELGDKTILTFTDPTLKMAIGAGCFTKKDGTPRKITPKTLGNSQVGVIEDSTAYQGYPIAVVKPDFTLEYYSDVSFKTKKPEVGKWGCDKLRTLQANSLNDELIKFVDNVRTAGTANVFNYSETKTLGGKTVDGTCTLTKLADFIKSKPELGSRTDIQSLLPIQNEAYIWVCSQSSATSENKALLDKYMSPQYGYKVCTEAQMATIKSKQGGKTSGQIESIDFIQVGTTYLCRTDKAYSKDPVYTSLVNASGTVAGGVTKEGCRTLIDTYLTAAKKGLKIPQDEINTFKMGINDCRNDETVKLDGLFSKKFQKAIAELEYFKTKTYKNLDGTVNTLDYRLKTGAENTLRESKEKMLKSLIRENLTMISESKKKVLTEESNIITNRFLVITEGVEIKTKRQKNKIIGDLVSEAVILNNQGFTRTLINEQFWDMIKSFFGNTGTGVVQMISERIVQAIITTLTPLDKNGWVANIIVTTVGNIPPADYFNGKIFSCDYISDKLSKGIVEGIARKIQNEQGMEGPIYDVIRNSMIEMAEDTEFGMKIETMIGDMICPMLTGVKSKMDNTAETLKAKALA